MTNVNMVSLRSGVVEGSVIVVTVIVQFFFLVIDLKVKMVANYFTWYISMIHDKILHA